MSRISDLVSRFVDTKTKDEDGVIHNFTLDAEPVGRVEHGWLRLGGSGWVAYPADGTPTRVDNIAEGMRYLAHKLSDPKPTWQKELAQPIAALRDTPTTNA